MAQTLAFDCFFTSLNCQPLSKPAKLSTVNSSLSKLSTVNYQTILDFGLGILDWGLSTVNCQPLSKAGKLSTVNCQLSTVNCYTRLNLPSAIGMLCTSIPNRKITKQITICFMNICIKK
ncbi:MAG: hypothetical protein JGK32_26140 [Microcoleus sp. PH2017_31_RDM_U_A]|uniref:hypothetical protein n=1 Tax=unclassified Microcoleus TaxID=2642155 RepID=UPI001DC372D5|nr:MULTISPECIES: hypothetical protein [unclassified Microcoleus]MCC3546286.1 hypothetical protein [Microcoleus sp. PH2017_24_DOB_U_A]MCC3568727.1 hypothetical protein [Microcoleus sp. PH2017_31_RDM_U_A]